MQGWKQPCKWTSCKISISSYLLSSLQEEPGWAQGSRAPGVCVGVMHGAYAGTVVLWLLTAAAANVQYVRARENRNRPGLQTQNVPVLQISEQKSSEAPQERCSPF